MSIVPIVFYKIFILGFKYKTVIIE